MGVSQVMAAGTAEVHTYIVHTYHWPQHVALSLEAYERVS